MREKLSAFVISHNRASLLESCLRAVSFADELIVVDKSSTDGSAVVAARFADRVEVVPWSPTVEETRAFASSLCRHEWILFLDDDEILSPEAGPYLRQAMSETDAEIFAVPLRHYILGVHDEKAYYWPEAHYRVFRGGAVSFIPTVHGGTVWSRTISNSFRRRAVFASTICRILMSPASSSAPIGTPAARTGRA